MIVLDTPTLIEDASLLALRQALRLEIKGMYRHGRSAYAMIKERFGFTGSKQRVFDQFSAFLVQQRVLILK